MGEPYHQRKIESEMDRFEQEISSLAPNTTMSSSRPFIPAQLRRPMNQGHHHQHGHHNDNSHSNPAPPGTTNINTNAHPPPSSLTRPSPIIIR